MQKFVPFSNLHLLIIAGGIVLNIAIVWYAKNRAKVVDYQRDTNLFLWLMLGIYLFLTLTKIIQGEWTVQGNLPLHLCDISAWTLVYALMRKQDEAYEAGYFWGLIGALLAFGVPNVTQVNWYLIPFFVWHALLVAMPLYYMHTQKKYPTYRGLWKTVGITIVLGLLVMGANSLLGSNYMFVNEKIPSMDMLGLPDYPMYLLYLVPMMILFFHVLYLPVMLLKMRK
jgi:hypothetical integral membrane protein (TIGR02206 family)